MLADASPLATIGYSAAALAYAALFFPMLTAWRGQGAGGRLVAAVLVTSLWAALLALVATDSGIPTGDTIVVDAARYSALLWLLPLGVVSRGTARFAIATGRAVALAVFVVGLLASSIDRDYVDRIAAFGGLALPLSGLAALASALRLPGPGGRPGQPQLQLAVGGLLACDLALYAVAVVPGLETTAIWTVRGYVAALGMPYHESGRSITTRS